MPWGANNPLRIVLCRVQRMMRVFFTLPIITYNVKYCKRTPAPVASEQGLCLFILLQICRNPLTQAVFA